MTINIHETAIYQPQEDSFLLEAFAKRYSKTGGNVLDVGTGSGILAFAAAEEGANVLAVDIDKDALAYVEEEKVKKELPNVSTRYSNLFEAIKEDERFDLIVCNPPYLPDEKSKWRKAAANKALDGGPDGYEFILKFLDGAMEHLEPNGIILILFSSLSNKERIDMEIKNRHLVATQVAELALFFERLYIYEIRMRR